jgi:endonuclease/exonuclease/phosphatase (EEP) superfamily protein YafD
MRWLDRLLLTCAALAVLVQLLPLGARLSWILELTTHFRVQYVAVSVLLLVALALRRQWTACGALVIASAVSATPLLPYLPLTRTEQSAAAPVSLRLLTVNVSFRQFSARRLLELIRESAPDVVVVQELTPHADSVLADLDTAFPHHHKFAADGPTGIGLWSRLPLESSKTFALGRAPAIEGRVQTPAGIVTVIGVHLRAPVSSTRAAARNQQLRSLAASSAEISGPLVVAGDFNITPYSPYFVDWLDASGLTDSRRGRTLSVSWPATLPWFGIPIDHVAVNDGLTILSHERLPHFESDHYGVLVELAHGSAEKP